MVFYCCFENFTTSTLKLTRELDFYDLLTPWQSGHITHVQFCVSLSIVSFQKSNQVILIRIWNWMTAYKKNWIEMANYLNSFSSKNKMEIFIHYSTLKIKFYLTKIDIGYFREIIKNIHFYWIESGNLSGNQKWQF